MMIDRIKEILKQAPEEACGLFYFQNKKVMAFYADGTHIPSDNLSGYIDIDLGDKSFFVASRKNINEDWKIDNKNCRAT